MNQPRSQIRYDARTPIAVFLGPSLEVERARAILPANYYPPARMGDVYRLLATGVWMIVIIDGVFHASAPVWQREILAAVRAGIIVVGASSMGALRAAELRPYGMVGCGTVFRWYVDGVIEGDDEVALLHAPADQGYCPSSEPLVDLRHDLNRACQAGLIQPEGAPALIAWLKGLYYGDRTRDALFASPPFARLSASEQLNLRTFLIEEQTSVKRQDALEVLRMCARHGEGIGRLTTGEPGGTVVNRSFAMMTRGVLTSCGRLVPLRELVALAAHDREATRALLVAEARRFFLLEWMRLRGLAVPIAARTDFEAKWRTRYIRGDFARWLQANGLTPDEYESMIAERSAEAWLLEQAPWTYGLSPDPEEPGSTYLCDWAELAGIDWPEPCSTTNARVRWLLERTPAHFGCTEWSPDVACAGALQVTGRVAEFARSV